MVLELIAVFSVALFTGAAIYINLVEHPARVECGTSAAMQQWRPSYRRAAVLQASLALIGFATAVGSWFRGRGAAVLVAALLIGAVIPFTLLVIYPTNQALHNPSLDTGSADAAALLAKWNRLHAVRSGLALAALITLLLHLGGAV
ncbi:MAG: DUF1772 domain-containing protein [Steroidobacteraceae bacterium]